MSVHDIDGQRGGRGGDRDERDRRPTGPTGPTGPIEPDEPDEPAASEDLRVLAVLDVLGGAARSDVCRRLAVDPVLLHRWVNDFVAAGTAQVTNRPLPDAARQRDRFLAAYAHELRSPLAVAAGWSSMLLEEDLPPASAQQGVRRLHDALATLTSRTLDVEMLVAASLGRLVVHPRPVAVSDVAAALALAETRATTGLPTETTPVHVVPRAAGVRLEVDVALAARVLRDLWRAAHLEPDPVDVRLDHRVVGPWHELRVLRRGAPVPVERLRGLFEPFELDDDGTGVTVGLYLARALAVAQGGAIGAEQDDEGAVLWLRLPVDSAQRPATTDPQGQTPCPPTDHRLDRPTPEETP